MLFGMSDEEKKLFHGYFVESGRLLGLQVVVHQIASRSVDFRQDPIFSYKPPVIVSAHLDEHPKVQTLKGLGWYHEDEEVLPLIIYLAPYDINGEEIFICEGVKIEVPYQVSRFDSREFVVARVDSFTPSNLFWVCKLAPARVNELPEPSGDPNYKILRVG